MTVILSVLVLGIVLVLAIVVAFALFISLGDWLLGKIYDLWSD